MSDVEIITLGGMLVLLVIGVALMLSPIKSGKEPGASAPERVEPQVDGELVIAEMREAFRRVQEVDDAATLSALVETTDDYPGLTGNDALKRQTESEHEHAGDEDLYLVAIREADGEERQPALWAKVMTLNEGNEEKARYHYIRLRAAQMIRNMRTPEIETSNGVDRNLTENMNSFAASRTPDATEAQQITVPGEVFDQNTIVDAISQRIPLGRLVDSAQLLADYFVSEYVNKDLVREKAVERGSPHHDAASYFNSYRHRTSVAVADVLKNVEAAVANKHLESRHFHHPYTVDFFDEVVVGTILPGSSRMEFLVLSPTASLDDDILKGLMASSRITELFMAAGSERDNPLVLYQELERVFAYFGNRKA